VGIFHQTLANPVTVNPDVGKSGPQYEKFCSQLNTYIKRHVEFEQEDFQTVLRAAGETETTQENIQDWLELDEGDPGFQLLTKEEIAAVIFYLFSYFHQHCLYY
jgi:hypothetical protein